MLKRTYEWQRARPFECVATCLSMVAASEGFVYSAGVICDYFGVNVPPEYCGPIKNIRKTNEKAVHGIVVKPEMLPEFFKHFSLPFSEQYHHISGFNSYDIPEFLAERLNAGAHIFAGYDYGYLRSGVRNEIGHVSIITACSGTNIEFYDPGPQDPGLKTVSEDDLYGAIRSKSDGFWVITKT